MALNAILSNTYGPHFIDVRKWLVDHYNPGQPADVAAFNGDYLPPSLISSYPHLNPAGYNLVAVKCFEASFFANSSILSQGQQVMSLTSPPPIGSVTPNYGFFSYLSGGPLLDTFLDLEQANLVDGLFVDRQASTYLTSRETMWFYAPLVLNGTHVGGSSRAALVFNTDPFNSYIQSSGFYGGSGLPLNLNPFSGNVGIGTGVNAAISTLEVNGVITADAGFAGDGSRLTNVNAAAISGTIPDAALPSDLRQSFANLNQKVQDQAKQIEARTAEIAQMKQSLEDLTKAVRVTPAEK